MTVKYTQYELVSVKLKKSAIKYIVLVRWMFKISNKSGLKIAMLTINTYNDGMNFLEFIDNSQESRQKSFNYILNLI